VFDQFRDALGGLFDDARRARGLQNRRSQESGANFGVAVVQNAEKCGIAGGLGRFGARNEFQSVGGRDICKCGCVLTGLTVWYAPMIA
jgi:hypothetical protein